MEGQLEYPQYTKPAVFRGHPVPEVLLSGNHGEVQKWRREQARIATMKKRPDLAKGSEGASED
jgi:tRNA (guanine37-N1)-methyltransferase